MRKLSFIICVLLSLSLCSVAYAAEPDSSPIPQLGPGVTYAESLDSSSATRAAGTVMDWSNSISKTSSSSIRCTSFTTTSALTDSIKIEYIVYRYDGGWQRYKSGTHSKSRTTLFSDSMSFSVNPGYSYYVKTYHRAYSGSTCISEKISSSGSIFVS